MDGTDNLKRNIECVAHSKLSHTPSHWTLHFRQNRTHARTHAHTKRTALIFNLFTYDKGHSIKISLIWFLCGICARLTRMFTSRVSFWEVQVDWKYGTISRCVHLIIFPSRFVGHEYGFSLLRFQMLSMCKYILLTCARNGEKMTEKWRVLQKIQCKLNEIVETV